MCKMFSLEIFFSLFSFKLARHSKRFAFKKHRLNGNVFKKSENNYTRNVSIKENELRKNFMKLKYRTIHEIYGIFSSMMFSKQFSIDFHFLFWWKSFRTYFQEVRWFRSCFFVVIVMWHYLRSSIFRNKKIFHIFSHRDYAWNIPRIALLTSKFWCGIECYFIY